MPQPRSQRARDTDDLKKKAAFEETSKNYSTYAAEKEAKIKYDDLLISLRQL